MGEAYFEEIVASRNAHQPNANCIRRKGKERRDR